MGIHKYNNTKITKKYKYLRENVHMAYKGRDRTIPSACWNVTLNIMIGRERAKCRSTVNLGAARVPPLNMQSRDHANRAILLVLYVQASMDCTLIILCRYLPSNIFKLLILWKLMVQDYFDKIV